MHDMCAYPTLELLDLVTDPIIRSIQLPIIGPIKRPIVSQFNGWSSAYCWPNSLTFQQPSIGLVTAFGHLSTTSPRPFNNHVVTDYHLCCLWSLSLPPLTTVSTIINHHLVTISVAFCHHCFHCPPFCKEWVDPIVSTRGLTHRVHSSKSTCLLIRAKNKQTKKQKQPRPKQKDRIRLRPSNNCPTSLSIMLA